MNSPYKWANRKDEEDDQTSSWESEPGSARRGRRVVLAKEGQSHQMGMENCLATLNHLVSRSAAGTQWTWKKVNVVVDLGAAENAMPRSMFPEIGIRQTERSKNGKRFQGPGGENI